MEDNIKCKLICGGSSRHLNTFSNCLLLLYTTHINTCYALLLFDCTKAPSKLGNIA